MRHSFIITSPIIVMITIIRHHKIYASDQNNQLPQNLNANRKDKGKGAEVEALVPSVSEYIRVHICAHLKCEIYQRKIKYL